MALIPAFFADCVVAIGTVDDKGRPDWIASGFFYGQFLEAHDNQKRSYSVYLVSNRHVFRDLAMAYVRCNPKASQPAATWNMPLQDQDGKPLWYSHPNQEIDVAVVPVNIRLLKKKAMQVSYFTSDTHAATIGKLLELGITEGDFAYVLGFPMGLTGGERNVVLVRSGSIARIRDALAHVSNEFLVDAFVFPGNSGGPVVSKPEMLSITGTKSQHAAYLIGVVKSYVPYKDVAISAQTGQPRVVFEENSGLAAVHPVDFIEEAIQEHLRAKQAPQEPADSVP
jgi:hypothetical protein